MDWDSFLSDAKYIRAKEGDLFEKATDDYLRALKVEQAKQDMKWDIEEVLGVSITDPFAQDFLQSNADYLREMLALRQLYWYFLERTNGEGSLTQIKADVYKKLYNERRSRLGSLIVYKRPNVDTLQVTR
ncbi:MAG: hypothetical protein N2560_08770 [Ignavibacteria bacterium]|nr:hypothetical protein [Ignavibacteria bacterium]